MTRASIHPASPMTVAGRAPGGWFQTLADSVAAWRLRRRTARELARLGNISPHLLRDIGVEDAASPRRWAGDRR